jgi:hypothetical protein
MILPEHRAGHQLGQERAIDDYGFVIGGGVLLIFVANRRHLGRARIKDLEIEFHFVGQSG